MNVNEVLSLMPPVGNWRKLYYRDGTTSDIIRVLEINFPEAVRITRKCAKLFQGKNDFQSCENVWDFLTTNVEYQADGNKSQNIRLPNYLLKSGKGDCKSLALFADSILFNMGIPVAFRYVNFKEGPLTHVYSLANPGKKNEIIIDAVYKRFNAEHPYYTKRDRKMDVAVMGALPQGLTRDELIIRRRALINRLTSLPIQNGWERTLIKEELKRIDSCLDSGVSGISGVKKIALSIPRNAYLGLVNENAFGIASHLNSAIQKNPGAIKKIWEKLGGNYSKLVASVSNGARKKKLLGIGGIGDPISFGALLASSAAIVGAVGSVIKSVDPNNTAADDLDTASQATGAASQVVTQISSPGIVPPSSSSPTVAPSIQADQASWNWTSPAYTQVKISPGGKIVTIPSSVKTGGYDPSQPSSLTNRPGVAPDSGPVSDWLKENGYLPKNIQITAPDGSQLIITDDESGGNGGSASDTSSSEKSSPIIPIALGAGLLKLLHVI